MAQPRVPERWSDARAQLMPLLRRVTEPAHAWYAALADPGNTLVRRPVAPMLHALLVLDLPDTRVFVSRALLDRWGVTENTAFGAALETLGAHAEQGLRRRPEYGGLWQVASDDRYETSRLLLPGFLTAFAGQVPGEPIVALPAGRVALVGGAGSIDQVTTLVDLAERAFCAADNPLSPVLYAGGLLPWVPPHDHPLRERVLALHALLVAHAYEAQREQLTGNPTVRSAVAPVELTEHGGRTLTRTRWVADLGETLLPVVDRVLLTDSSGETEVSWSSVWAHARGCLTSTRLDPERFRARWPLRSTLDRMTA